MPRMLSEPGRIVLSTDTVGGVWTYALDLARALAGQGAGHGIEVVLMIVGPPPSAAQRRAVDAISGVTPVVADLPLDWTARDEREVAEAGEAFFFQCRAFDPDIVHLNSPGFAAAAQRQGESADNPTLIVGLHSCVASWWSAVYPGIDLPPDLAWQRRMVYRGLAKADAVIVPSHAFGAAIKSHYGDGISVAAIPNGRHPRFPGRSEGTGRSVLTAGRLWDRGKNVAILDRAAALLPFPIEAAGPVREPRPGAAMAVFPNLKLLGELDEAAMQDRFDAAAVFVSAAIYEPFGLAVLEAALARCALVLSDIPTFRELWDGAAVFVDPVDADGFAHEIDRLRADDAARAALADAAACRARRYRDDTMATETAALYRRVAADRMARVGVPA